MNTTNVILSVIAVAVVIIASILIYKWNEEEQIKRNIQDAITNTKLQEEEEQLVRLGATNEAAECFTEMVRNNPEDSENRKHAMQYCNVFPKPNPQGDCMMAMVKNNTDAAIGVPRCLAFEEEVNAAIHSAERDCLDKIPSGITGSNETAAINECIEKSWEVYDPPFEVT